LIKINRNISGNGRMYMCVCRDIILNCIIAELLISSESFLCDMAAENN